MINEEFKDNHGAARELHSATPMLAYTVGGYAKDFERNHYEVGPHRYRYDETCSKIARIRSVLAKSYFPKTAVKFRKRTRAPR